MYSVLKTSTRTPNIRPHADTDGDGRDPLPDDPWLFTDPDAKAIYLRRGRLAHLERDIRFYVMFNGQWSSDELAFKREVHRLLITGTLVSQPAFGYLSPHPTIYRAIDEGSLAVGSRKFHFAIGDEVVFEPRLSRLYHPGLTGPLRIGRMDTTTHIRLCCEAFPLLKDLHDRDFAALNEILFIR